MRKTRTGERAKEKPMEPEDLYEGGRQLMPILTGTNDKLRRALPGETGIVTRHPLPCG